MSKIAAGICFAASLAFLTDLYVNQLGFWSFYLAGSWMLGSELLNEKPGRTRTNRTYK